MRRSGWSCWLGEGEVTLALRLLSPELIDFKTRRVAAFRKNLVELAELELKHAKVRVVQREAATLS